jgi:putative membrane protein
MSTRGARRAARAAKPAPVVPTTADFVRTATIAGMFEIESSKVAQQNSQDPKVQAFAKMMIDDHTKAGDELKAKAQGISGVEVPTALDAENQTELNRLKASSGDRFLKQYRRVQLKGHREAVQLFKGYAAGGDNAGLKAWANTTLPTLTHHLREARNLPKGAGRSPTGGAAPAAPAAPASPAAPK